MAIYCPPSNCLSIYIMLIKYCIQRENMKLVILRDQVSKGMMSIFDSKYIKNLVLSIRIIKP